MKKFLLLTLSLFAVLTSCVKQPEMGSNLLVITAVKGDFDTKATETAFEVGDKIGLYINENVGNLPYETLDGTSWKCLGFLGEFLAGKEYFATAYYPYSESATNPSAIEVSSGIDFMVSAKTKLDISGNEAAGTLQFKHVLSKLVVSIDTPEEIDGIPTVSLDSIIIKNVFRKAVININESTVEFSNFSDKGDIVVSNGEAIIIPQAVSRIEFVFKRVDGTFSKLAYVKGVVLESGKKTTLNAHSNADLYFNSVLDLKNGDAQTDLPLSIFVATGRAWTLTSSAPWLTISPNAGTGAGLPINVNVSVTANTASPYAPRTAKLTLKDDKPSAVSMNVMQNYSKFELSADKPNEIVPKAGKAYTVTINSNKPWSVTAKTNVTVAPESGLGTTTVTITVPATTVYTTREVKAVFSTTGNYITSTWSGTQKKAQLPGTVDINGEYWRSTNLAGTAGQSTSVSAAASPQDYGMFFKWGDKWVYQHAGSSTDGDWSTIISGASTNPATSGTGGTGYDYVGLSGGRASGDPCKLLGAYRTPTRAQWVALNNSGTKWGTYQGVNGRFFGPSANTESCNNTSIAANCIFLPAAGNRNRNGGGLDNEATGGRYWSSSVGNSTACYDCFFDSGFINPENGNSRGGGFSVRCVQE